ncbi:MAG: MtdA bifunctional protein [Pirellulaceae bacterium]|nr:MAG: MtdA bifunctional protein [Pirellulaceae bacterium]
MLIQLDSDPQASTFDAIVAVDAGVDQLLTRSGVRPNEVAPLVHGAIFTRGLDDLKQSAIFIGGSDVQAGEALLDAVRQAFFGPFRVSVMLDSNGANTTAAAAVLAVERHLSLAGARVLVLGGTGPVGRRVARLLAASGAVVGVASRERSRAEMACSEIQRRLAQPAQLAPLDPHQLPAFLAEAQALVATGAAGAKLLDEEQWRKAERLRVMVDLNAVPPAGIQGVEPQDRQVERHGVICYGALGVGGWKMKIHRRAVQMLFEKNDQVLDAEEILALGRQLLQPTSS